MKFIGGSRNGSDAPMWVQQLVLGGWKSVELEEVDNGGWGGRPGARPVETYHVRSWHFSDGRAPVKFLAIAGKDRDYIESLAAPMFRKT